MRLFESGRHVLKTEPESRCGLIYEVDGLVRQEAFGDVTAGEFHGRDDGIVRDTHAVVEFIFFLEPAQDGDGIFDGRFLHIDRLEAARESGVVFNVALIFLERGRAYDAYLATRERRLKHIRCIDCAFGGACAYQSVELIDEKDYLAFRLLYFFHDRFQALFEFTAELGPSDEHAEIEHDEILTTERFGDVPACHALGETFGDGSLPHARFADQDGIVLGSAGQYLDDADDLLIATNDRIKLVLPCKVSERASETLKRAGALVHGFCIVDLPLFDIRKHPRDGRAVDAETVQHLSRLPRVFERREQEMFGGDKLIIETRCDARSRLEYLCELLRDIQLEARRGDHAARSAIELFQDRIREVHGIDRELFEYGEHHAFLLSEEGSK